MAKDCCPIENEEDKKHVEGEDHDHDHGDSSSFKAYIPSIISFVLLMSGLAFDNLLKPEFFENEIVRLIWYSLAYLPVGISVFKEAIGGIAKGDFFTEFTLMTVATIGAFILGEYPEGVAVMLFYAVGELFQNAAVSRAKSNIKALLDVRPETATVKRNGNWEVVEPEQVEVGEIIQLKVGERAPLDGVLQSDSSNFNTVALTGESTPQTIK
ncbi:MAG: heavy metal translocating P-type ATPase, partial [Moheibacter sp.]